MKQSPSATLFRAETCIFWDGIVRCHKTSPISSALRTTTLSYYTISFLLCLLFHSFYDETVNMDLLLGLAVHYGLFDAANSFSPRFIIVTP